MLPETRLRVAYSHTLGYANVQPDVARIFARAVEQFRALNVDLESVEKAIR